MTIDIPLMVGKLVGVRVWRDESRWWELPLGRR